MIETILITIFLVLIIFKILGDIYLFQVKEYRIDRIAASVHDMGFVQTFITYKKMPAKTVRNALTALFSIVLLLFYCLLIIHIPVLLFLSILLFPFVSFTIVYSSILASGVFAGIKRALIIKKAESLLSQSKTTVIGITGSYGKTTTKEYLYHILSQKYKVAKTDENMNTDVGVALSVIKNLKKDAQYFIAEMGAYRKGEIRKICNLVHPTYAILTSIGNQHVDLFGSKNNLISAKKELLLSLPPEGKAYINVDNVPKTLISEAVVAQKYFFLHNDAFPFEFNLNEEIIKQNLIPCIALALDLGMEKQKIVQAILSLKTLKNRLAPIPGINKSTVINNSYNTSVESFIYAIGLLEKRQDRKKFIVSRGIIELGNEKQKSYERMLHVLAKSDISLFTTDEDFMKGSISNVHYFKSERALSSTILKELDENTVVLFEGKYDNKVITSVLNI